MLNLDNILREDTKFIVADVESESLRLLDKNRPWSVAWLVCEGTKIVDQFDLYPFWDDLKVSVGAAIVTKFNQNTYQNKSGDKKEILDIFENYLYNEDYWIIFHNGHQFDCYIHNIWRKELGLKTDYSYIDRMIDTNALARGIKTNQKYKPGENFLAYQYRMLNFKQKGLKTNLTSLGKELKINWDYDSLHGSLSDIKLCKVIWDKWIKYNFVY